MLFILTACFVLKTGCYFCLTETSVFGFYDDLQDFLPSAGYPYGDGYPAKNLILGEEKMHISTREPSATTMNNTQNGSD